MPVLSLHMFLDALKVLLGTQQHSFWSKHYKLINLYEYSCLYLEALRCLKCIRKVFKMLEHSLKSSSCSIFVGFFTLCYRRCSKI